MIPFLFLNYFFFSSSFFLFFFFFFFFNKILFFFFFFFFCCQGFFFFFFFFLLFFFYFFFFFFFLSFCHFLGCSRGIWRFPGQGSNRSCSRQPTPEPQQHGIRAVSCVCNLHHSSRQRRILNPLSKARDRTRNLMVPSWIR